MTRKTLRVIVGILILLPFVMKAQEPLSRAGAKANSNQVYVKIIMPTDAVAADKERPVVESWIAKELQKRGQTKFIAVTGWVTLALSPFEATDLWDGGKLGGVYYCPVGADIPKRGEGRIKVLVGGWGPTGTEVSISLMDEPGSRAIAGVKDQKTKQGMPYVAVLITPPIQNGIIPLGGKK